MVHEYFKWPNKYCSGYFSLSPILAKLEVNSAKDLLLTTPYVRHFAKVNCFGYTVNEGNIAQAAIKLIGQINDMANNGYVIASLTKLGLFELAHIDYSKPKQYIVMSYLAIDHVHEPLVHAKYNSCIFIEGALPPEFK